MSDLEFGPSALQEALKSFRPVTELDIDETLGDLGLEEVSRGLAQRQQDQAAEFEAEQRRISVDPVIHEKEVISQTPQRGGGPGGSSGNPGQVDDKDEGELFETQAGIAEEAIAAQMAEEAAQEAEEAKRALAKAAEVEKKLAEDRLSEEERKAKRLEELRAEKEAVEVIGVPVTAPLDFKELEYVSSTRFEAMGVDKFISLKTFPSEIIEALRESLRPLGQEFAREISAISLVTAFVSAHLGIRMKFDENTEEAMRGFKQINPNLTGVEDRIDALTKTMTKMISAQRRTRESIEESRVDILAIAMAQSWHLADYISPAQGLEVVNANSLELDTPRVVQTLENMRKYSKKSIQKDVIKKGSPF